MTDRELLLLAAGVAYGPLLAVTAFAIYAASLGPARRRLRPLERLARRPLFWVVVPPLVALVQALSFLELGRSEALALASGPTVTLTKATTAHFQAPGSTLSAYMNSASDKLELVSSLTPSTSMTIGPVAPFLTGDGGHAVEAANGEFLIFHGEGTANTSVLSPISGTFLSGSPYTPSFPGGTKIGKGAFSLPRGDGTFLLVAGGDTDVGANPLLTFIITPPASVGGQWTATAGPNLSGNGGAGNGAHAVKFTDSLDKFLIVHAGGGNNGTADTSIYTPSTNGMVAGPAFASNKKAGKGALAIPRTDGKFLVVLAGGANDTQIYTPPSGGGTGSFAVGPNMGGPTGEGSFAIQYKNASNQDRYVIVRGGTQSGQVYDPAATPATSAGMVTTLSTPNALHGNSTIGLGGSGFLRADGTVVCFYGGTNDLTFLFTPSSSTEGAFTTLNLTNAIPMERGSFALQQADGKFMVVAGAQVETRLNDAGWALKATYESEPLNPGNVDKWTQIGWKRGANDLTLEWRSATAKDLLANSSYTTVNTSTGTTGSVTIAPAVTNKWLQVRVTISRPDAASTGAEAGVWLGSDSVVQIRGITAPSPILDDYTLQYSTGVFVLSAASPAIAGVGFPLTVELRDSANARIVDYQGNHTLTFSGAATAPDGVTKPTVRDRAGADISFGSPTGLSFDTTGLSIGTATPRTLLYKREEINVAATETVTTPGPFAAFDLTTHTMTTATAAHIIVNAAGPSGTKSTVVASPRTVVPDGVSTSTLTVTVSDAYGNLLPGYQVTVSSSRGSTDTFSKTTLAPSDFNGSTTTTILSSTRGTASVTGTVQGPPSPVAVPKRYFGTTATAFRAGPDGSTLWQAPTTAPGSGDTTTKLDFGTGIGSRLAKPGTTNAVAGSGGSSATNFGWRDESYSRSGQDASSSQLSGDFTFTYSLALTTGTSAVTGRMTVVAYAVAANNTARELFRNTSRNLSIGQAELNHIHTFTPVYAVLSGVTGGLAANEILQYELFLNLTANPNSVSGAVVQLRAGAAASGLVAPALEGGGIAASPSTTQSTVITPATTVSFLGAQQSITLTKSTTTHFDANGGTKSSVVTTGDKIVVSGTPAAAVTACSGGGCPGAVGAGGHALAGNGGEFLIVRGGGSTGGAIYAAGSITSSPTIGAVPIGTGAFSLPRGDGTYLLIAGGSGDGGSSPLKTFVVTPAASAGGSWSFTAGPDLAGVTGAGAGAHALQRTASQYLLVHGGATAKTSLYTPGTNTMSAGPDLGANAGAGAHSVARADGTFLVALGGGSSSTNLYDPVGNSFSAGPALGAAVGDGGHAIQYTNGSSQARFLLVLGGGSTTTKIYDPAATPAASAGVTNGPAAPAVGAGGHRMLRGDGSYLLLGGGASTSAASFSPSAETFSVVTLTSLPTLGAGAYSFQRSSDGLFVIVAGNAGTAIASYDAGWALTGTYTTEPLNPGHVDSWNTMTWTMTAAAGGTLTVSVRTATVSGGGSYVSLASATTTSGSTAIGGPVGNRWAQVQLVLARVVPASSGAEQGVWLGSSSVAQVRSLGPAVTKLEIGYTSGAFVVTASTTQTAGTSNTATVTFKDSAGTTITDYTAGHTLVFAGASNAPNGTVPTAAGTSFGSNTSLTFANGAATAALLLYKAQTADVSVSEDSATITPATTYSLSAFQIGTTTPATIAVSAAAANAANSTMSSLPTAVPADNATTSLIAVTLKDAYQNPISGLSTVTLASYVSVAGDRAAYDTLSTPGTTSSDGVTTGTIKSTRFGTVTITVSVGGSPLAIAPAATVTFGASVFTVVTQNGGTETAGTAFTLTMTAKDASGTAVTNYSGSKTLTFTSTAGRRTSPGTGPLPIVTTPQTVSFTSGVGTTSTGTGASCGQPVVSPAIPCQFTLYNTAQQPTITATDGAFPTGTTAALTIVPAAVSLTVSTLTADPLTVAPDAKDTTNITTRVMDAYYNPISGKAVTLSSSRQATDTIIQPPTSDANGLAVGQMTSLTVGTPTVSAAVTGAGTLTATVAINFVTPGGATRVLVIRTQNVERETAGVAFSLTITGIKNDGSIDPVFCNSANCTLTVTNTATAAPDGTAPTGTTTSSIRFSQGSYTTNVTDGNLTTFYRANQDPAPILTVTAVSGPNSIVGVTPGIIVSPNTNVNQYANILAKSYVYAVPDIAPADGTTTVTLGGKVVDNWKNPISGRTVTFTSSRGGTDTITQSATETGALGLVFGTMKSSTAGAATVTGADSIIGTLTSTAATVSFFGEPGGGRVQNGTRLGSVTNGVAADTPLAMVARDLAGVELDVATPVSWEVSGAGGGTLSTTLTTSGAETPTHSTFFTGTRAGTVTVRGGYVIPDGSTGAGTQVNVEISFKIVSQFEVTAVTTFGRTISARVEWDGTRLRTLSWVTTSP